MVQGKYALEFMDTDFPCLVQDIEQNTEAAEHFWSTLIEVGNVSAAAGPTIDDDGCGLAIADTDVTELPTTSSGSDITPGTSRVRRGGSKVLTSPRSFSFKNLFKGSPSNGEASVQSVSMHSQRLEDTLIKLEDKMDASVRELKSTLLKQLNKLESVNTALVQENKDMRHRIGILEKNVGDCQSQQRVSRPECGCDNDIIGLKTKTSSMESDMKEERDRVCGLVDRVHNLESKSEAGCADRTSENKDLNVPAVESVNAEHKQPQAAAGGPTHIDDPPDDPPATQSHFNVSVRNRYDAISDTSLVESITSPGEWVTLDSLEETSHISDDDVTPWKQATNRAGRTNRSQFDCDVQLIGTSIIKNIDGGRLYKNKQVHVCKLDKTSISGASAFLDQMTSKPKVVLYQVGSNDLMRNPADKVMSDLVDLIEKTRAKLVHTKIAVSPILPRWLRNKDDSMFEQRRWDLNNRLASYCEGEDDVSLITHEQFWQNDTYDGVHLTSRGVSKLVRSYKQCINDCLDMTPYSSYNLSRYRTTNEEQTTYESNYSRLEKDSTKPRSDTRHKGQVESTVSRGALDKRDVLLSKLAELLTDYSSQC